MNEVESGGVCHLHETGLAENGGRDRAHGQRQMPQRAGAETLQAFYPPTGATSKAVTSDIVSPVWL